VEASPPYRNTQIRDHYAIIKQLCTSNQTNLAEALALFQGVREAGLSGGKAGLPLTQSPRSPRLHIPLPKQ